MTVPNWQHHSKKGAKRKLKPQALRSAKRAKQALLNKLMNKDPGQSGRGFSFGVGYGSDGAHAPHHSSMSTVGQRDSKGLAVEEGGLKRHSRRVSSGVTRQ